MTAYSEILESCRHARQREALDELTERHAADHAAAQREDVRERLSAVEGYLNATYGPRDNVLDLTFERDDAGCWIVLGCPLGSDSWEPLGCLDDIERDANDWRETVAIDERLDYLVRQSEASAEEFHEAANEIRIRLSRESGRLAFASRRFRIPTGCDDDVEAAAWLQGYDAAKAEATSAE